MSSLKETELVASHSELNSSAHVYEEVRVLRAPNSNQQKDNNYTDQEFYSCICDELQDGNSSQTPDAASITHVKANSVSGKANGIEKNVVKKLACAFFIIVLMMFALMVFLSLSFAMLFSEMQSLKSVLASCHQAVYNHSQTLDSLAKSYIEMNAHSSALKDDIKSISNNTFDFDRFFELQDNTHRIMEIIDSLGQPSAPAASCAALLSFHPSSLSGYYWVRASNGSAVRVYCDMTLSCGGVTGGWARVVHLNIMDKRSTQCPPTLPFRDDVILCAIESISVLFCSSTSFNSRNVLYSSVCGRVAAYQGGSPQAFHPENDIDSPYVSGISLTHGSPRQHIWTFAAASNETHNTCPCSKINTSGILPFVGSDYFCDGISPDTTRGLFELGSPVWDGAECSPTNRCCSFNNPPWFYKQLSQPTTDDIEMRVCRNEPRANIGIEALELYVQ